MYATSHSVLESGTALQDGSELDLFGPVWLNSVNWLSLKKTAKNFQIKKNTFLVV